MNVEFIAEIGANHNGSMDRLHDLIKAARGVGFDAVKLQYIKSASDIYREPEGKTVRTLPADFTLEKVRRYAGDLKLGFTVFDVAHIEELRPYADFWKVSSYDAEREDLIDALTGKPLYISVGLARRKNLLILDHHHKNSALLHSVSLYPCPVDKADVRGIWGARVSLVRNWPFSRDSGTFRAGYSDHTCSPAVIYRAVHRWGAEVIEMHFDLDDAKGEEMPHSWLPPLAKRTIREVREGFAADEYDPSAVQAERQWMADPSDGKRPRRGKQ